MSLSLVLDDTSNLSDLISYGGGTWTTSSSPRWFGGSTQYPKFMSGPPPTGLVATMSLSFQGTSISFWGNTNPAVLDLNVLTVSIDGGQSYNTSFTNPSRQTWQQWYQSPTLVEGVHQIVFSHIGQAMDVAIITTGNQSALPGQAAIVDNESSAIAYTGSWTQDIDAINSDSTTFPIMVAYGNSTARSTTVGDSFTFQFTGTSATVWGVMSPRFAGTLQVNYTIDGGTPIEQDYSVATAKEMPDVPNSALFTQGNLSAENHTLVLQITACVGQTFIFDYITYTPSFLATISPSSLPPPSLSNITSPNNPIPPSGVRSPGTTTTGISASTSTSSKPSIGAIIGAICGIIGLIIIVLFFWLHRRRQTRYIDLADGTQAARSTARPVDLRRVVFPFRLDAVGTSESSPSWGSPRSNTSKASSASPLHTSIVHRTAHRGKAPLDANRHVYPPTPAVLSETILPETSRLSSTMMRSDTITRVPPPAYEW